jgi:hypothetical protein
VILLLVFIIGNCCLREDPQDIDVGYEDVIVTSDDELVDVEGNEYAVCASIGASFNEMEHNSMLPNGMGDKLVWKNKYYETISRICNGLKLGDRQCNFLLSELETLDMDWDIPRNVRQLRKAELDTIAGLEYTIKSCPIQPPRTPAPASILMVEHSEYELIHYDLKTVCEQLLSYVEHRLISTYPIFV